MPRVFGSTFAERRSFLVRAVSTNPHMSYKQARKMLMKEFGVSVGAKTMSNIMRTATPERTIPATALLPEPGCQNPEPILRAIKEVYGDAAEVRVEPDGTIFLFFDK